MSHSETSTAATHALSPQVDAISRSLVTARSNAHVLSEFPGELPDTLDEAYAIQAASIQRWSDDVAGWKVGMIPADLRARFGAERLAGPIFNSTIHRIEAGGSRSMPIHVGGFAAVEAEFVIELGVHVPPSNREYSEQELIELVSAWYVGVEIASSPMAAINILGPTCAVSDFGNNAGLVVGPEITDWHSRPLESMTVAVSVDDVVVGEASAAAIPGGPMQALRFLISMAAERDIELAKGTLVSTGASTGIHDVTPSSQSSVSFGEFGGFDLTFVPITPESWAE